MGKGWQHTHALVRSLLPAEKGYFRKYVSGFGGKEKSRMLALYDLLAQMPVLDEGKIRSALALDANRLKSIRTHLNKQLVHSLRAYRGIQNAGQELRSALDTIELLHEKGLYDQSIALLEKSVEKAEALHMYPYQILLLQKRDQLVKGHTEKIRFMETTAVSDSVITILHTMLRKEEIRKAHVRTVYWSNVYMPLRDAEVAAESRALLDKLLQIDADTITDYAEKNLLFSAISNIYLMHDEIDHAIAFQERTIRLMESVDLRALNKVLSYVAALYNLASLMIQARVPGGVRKVMATIRHLEAQTEHEKKFINAVLCFLRSVLLRFEHTNIFAEEEYHAIAADLGAEMVIPTLYHDTYFALLVYALQHAQYREALDRAYFLLHSPYAHSQVSMQVHVRLLHILIHYRMQHTLLLPSLIRQTYRYMRKQELKYAVEKSILYFFGSLLHRVDKEDMRRQFKKLHSELEMIAQEPGEMRVLHMYFNYLDWLEAEMQ